MKSSFLYVMAIFHPGIHNANATDGKTETIGNVLRIIIPSVAYAATWYNRDQQGRVQFYKSFLTNSVVTFGLKLAIDKERPDGSDQDSFPSGHTSYAMQGASFVHLRYG